MRAQEVIDAAYVLLGYEVTPMLIKLTTKRFLAYVNDSARVLVHDRHIVREFRITARNGRGDFRDLPFRVVEILKADASIGPVKIMAMQSSNTFSVSAPGDYTGDIMVEATYIPGDAETVRDVVDVPDDWLDELAKHVYAREIFYRADHGRPNRLQHFNEARAVSSLNRIKIIRYGVIYYEPKDKGSANEIMYLCPCGCGIVERFKAYTTKEDGIRGHVYFKPDEVSPYTGIVLSVTKIGLRKCMESSYHVDKSVIKFTFREC